MAESGPLPAACDLAIIGAGPAGLAAATTAAALSLSVAVFDEQHHVGGQIYRAITTTPVHEPAILGDDYWHGQSLVTAFERADVAYLPRSSVWAVTPAPDGGFEVGVSRDGVARLVRARHVIVATGAQERPFPIPGWTLPGVMTAGAAQILLKSSGMVPDVPTVLAGSGPLMYLVAAQLAAAGAPVARILDTTPRGRLAKQLGGALQFARSPYAAKGLALMRAARKSTTIVKGVERIEALGDTRMVRVRYLADGRAHEIDPGLLLLHQGVVPNLNLPNAIGCAQRWDELRATFVPVTDAFGASSVPGVTLAGDGAGIAGARAAEARGRLAALHAAAALGRIDVAARDARAREPRAELERWSRGRDFIDRLYRPADAFRVPDAVRSPDTIVCRCEEVTAGEIAKAIALGCPGPNQLKSFLRCGMGPCQGRFCGLTVTEMIAQARGVSPEVVGYYRLRFPVKPLTLGELASLPADAAAEAAVVRIGKGH